MDAADREDQPDILVRTRTYRLNVFSRVSAVFSGGLMFCMTLVAVYAVSTQAVDLPIEGILAVWLAMAIAAVGSLWAVVFGLSWRVTLTEDTIETSTWLSRRRLRRDEIAGRRMIDSGRGNRNLVVVPSSPGFHKISLPLRFLDQDATFSAWFSGLRDLNAEDLQSSLGDIAANTAFGDTPEERLRRLTQARKVAKALGLVAIGIALWSFLAPKPYPLVIASLAALPVLSMILVVLSRGMFRIGSGTTDAHADLGFACALPACAIMARMFFDSHMVSWVPLIGAACLSAGLFIVTIATAESSVRRQPWMFVGIALCAGAYAFGALGEANTLLDRSQWSTFRCQIIDKHVSHGKVTTYRLRLAPWGPVTEPRDVSVSHELYDRTELGTPACILLHEGALGMPWFVVQACR